MNISAAIGDGIFRIAVPITGSPLGHTLVYVVESPRGVVLVDAGWDDDAAWDALSTGLDEIGHGVAEVEGVVLTHFHPDHVGLCGRVREASGAWIAMHDSDRVHFDDMVAVRDTEWADAQKRTLRLAGASAADLAHFERDVRRTPPARPHAAPDRTLVDDEVIALAGRGLRVVHTPGHTPGHVCFYLDGVDVMFTGDHVLQKTSPHVGTSTVPLAERDALAEFMGSLHRVGSMRITRGLGAHGAVIDDVAGRAGALVEHHEEQLDHLHAAFGDEPITLWQVANLMRWYKPWAELPWAGKNLALSEAAAHLRHLVARGLVAAEPGEGAALFRRVRTSDSIAQHQECAAQTLRA
ncbi:MBL fold metallo-hydrolase [Rhodococcus koreensis]|uniref:Glyoxylase, beta-lactamase superfamily II n=1 Tax=Rhodococcus koreensis TaxID=99653 RepID=A0A1H4X9B6_9NOCA|nr:MBL fold metallo-hydrolase [Rhodococcus koreensis]SED02236.1 Glyoxylase, beta-lactamase superfamily II [Rhodococcus koreensis]